MKNSCLGSIRSNRNTQLVCDLSPSALRVPLWQVARQIGLTVVFFYIFCGARVSRSHAAARE